MVISLHLSDRSSLDALLLTDLGTGEETVSVEKTQVFVLQTVQMNTSPLQVELHQVLFLWKKYV